MRLTSYALLTLAAMMVAVVGASEGQDLNNPDAAEGKMQEGMPQLSDTAKQLLEGKGDVKNIGTLERSDLRLLRDEYAKTKRDQSDEILMALNEEIRWREDADKVRNVREALGKLISKLDLQVDEKDRSFRAKNVEDAVKQVQAIQEPEVRKELEGILTNLPGLENDSLAPLKQALANKIKTLKQEEFRQKLDILKGKAESDVKKMNELHLKIHRIFFFLQNDLSALIDEARADKDLDEVLKPVFEDYSKQLAAFARDPSADASLFEDILKALDGIVVIKPSERMLIKEPFEAILRKLLDELEKGVDPAKQEPLRDFTNLVQKLKFKDETNGAIFTSLVEEFKKKISDSLDLKLVELMEYESLSSQVSGGVEQVQTFSKQLTSNMKPATVPKLEPSVMAILFQDLGRRIPGVIDYAELVLGQKHKGLEELKTDWEALTDLYAEDQEDMELKNDIASEDEATAIHDAKLKMEQFESNIAKAKLPLKITSISNMIKTLNKLAKEKFDTLHGLAILKAKFNPMKDGISTAINNLSEELSGAQQKKPTEEQKQNVAKLRKEFEESVRSVEGSMSNAEEAIKEAGASAIADRQNQKLRSIVDEATQLAKDAVKLRFNNPAILQEVFIRFREVLKSINHRAEQIVDKQSSDIALDEDELKEMKKLLNDLGVKFARLSDILSSPERIADAKKFAELSTKLDNLKAEFDGLELTPDCMSLDKLNGFVDSVDEIRNAIENLKDATPGAKAIAMNKADQILAHIKALSNEITQEIDRNYENLKDDPSSITGILISKLKNIKANPGAVNRDYIQSIIEAWLKRAELSGDSLFNHGTQVFASYREWLNKELDQPRAHKCLAAIAVNLAKKEPSKPRAQSEQPQDWNIVYYL